MQYEIVNINNTDNPINIFKKMFNHHIQGSLICSFTLKLDTFFGIPKSVHQSIQNLLITARANLNIP